MNFLLPVVSHGSFRIDEKVYSFTSILRLKDRKEDPLVVYFCYSGNSFARTRKRDCSCVPAVNGGCRANEAKARVAEGQLSLMHPGVVPGSDTRRSVLT
jgi:hypothetical protein